MNDLAAYIELTQIYLLVTFVIALVVLDRSKISNKILLLILLVCVVNETATTIMLWSGKNTLLLNVGNVMLHNALWLLLIAVVCRAKAMWVVVLSYLFYCIASFFILQDLPLFTMAFISGAFAYLAEFIIESFRQLKKENFVFFTSTNYLLLAAPALFFIGISFICGFSNKTLAAYKLFGNVSLYQFIAHFVNIIYYSLVNYYIYKEKTAKNA